MTSRSVQAMLNAIGFRSSFWTRPEVRQLPHILSSDEQIFCAVSGRYDKGYALLVATDRRILLIDKKLLFLNLEDIRYEMIAEIDYGAQLFMASFTIRTINKSRIFTSIHQQSLRDFTYFVQQRIMQLRQATQQQTKTELPLLQTFNSAPSFWQTIPQQQVVQSVNTYQDPMYLRNPFPSTPLTMRRRIARFPMGIVGATSRLPVQSLENNVPKF